MHELGTFITTCALLSFAHYDSIVRDAVGKPTGVTSPMKLLVLDDSAGGSMLPLFTEADLATRFKKVSGSLNDFAIIAADAKMTGSQTADRHRRSRHISAG